MLTKRKIHVGAEPRQQDNRWTRAILLRLAVTGLVLLGLAAQPTASTHASPPYGLLKTYLNPAPAVNEEFGNAVALSSDGGSVFVAARGDQLNSGTPLGSVTILNTATGAVSRVLTETGSSQNDYFGYSLAISGTQALIGAPLNNGSNVKDGAAFLFDTPSGALLRSFFNPLITNTQEYFGSAVAILSDTAVLVGVPQYGVNIGRAYVCLIVDGSCLTPIDKPSSSTPDGLFGTAVASLGDKFAVAAPTDEGHGRVFIYTTTTAALYNTLVLTNANSGAYFGGALANVDGNLLVGARTHGTSVLNTPGAAYLFAPDGTLLQTFDNPDASDSSALFGAAVAGAGNLILIGAPGAHDNEGRAYLFNATTGQLMDTFKKVVPGAGDQFGSSVAISGEVFIVGTPEDGAGASNAGAVYRFGPLPPVPASLAGSSKTVNAISAWSGRPITYTLTLTNSGTLAANFALTDTLDANVSLVSAPGLTGGSTLTATGVLAGLAQLTFQVTVRTSLGFNGTVANVAHVSGDGTLRSLSAPLVIVADRIRLPLMWR